MTATMPDEKRAGRPKLPAEQRRSTPLQIRATREEHAAWIEVARQRDTSLSELVRAYLNRLAARARREREQ